MDSIARRSPLPRFTASPSKVDSRGTQTLRSSPAPAAPRPVADDFLRQGPALPALQPAALPAGRPGRRAPLGVDPRPSAGGLATRAVSGPGVHSEASARAQLSAPAPGHEWRLDGMGKSNPPLFLFSQVPTSPLALGSERTVGAESYLDALKAKESLPVAPPGLFWAVSQHGNGSATFRLFENRLEGFAGGAASR